MTLYIEEGSPDREISLAELKQLVHKALDVIGKKKKVIIVPPDFTRFHSKAGDVTQFAYDYYQDSVHDIIPALGTHAPMTDDQLTKMFGDIPKSLFRVHDWRKDVVTIGEVPKELVQLASDGKVNEPWPAQLNKLIWEGEHDLILSVGQVVPHEVMGMANYNKNLFVGTGGSQAINFSHFIGAVYGMERMMGRANNPLRQILNYASKHYMNHLPILYIHTVIGRSAENGELVIRGLYIGDDEQCFLKAAALSLQVNFTLVEAPLKKVVVYLDPEEFKSTWLGNKSIYRTRMAIADGGELIVLAPGVSEFGEDKEIDALIRQFGYRTTPEVLKHLSENRSLMKNLSAAAHLIHGSSEGRFRITYCPGHLTKDEIESVGFQYAPLDEMLHRYDPNTLQDGWNELELTNESEKEKVFYISNPAVGLWAFKDRFELSEALNNKPPHGSTTAPTALASGDTNTPCCDVGIGGGPFAASSSSAPRNEKRAKLE